MHSCTANRQEDGSGDALQVGGRGLCVVAQLSGGRCGVHTTRLCGNGRLGEGVWLAIPVDRANEAVCAMPSRAPHEGATAQRFLEIKPATEPRICGRF